MCVCAHYFRIGFEECDKYMVGFIIPSILFVIINVVLFTIYPEGGFARLVWSCWITFLILIIVYIIKYKKCKKNKVDEDYIKDESK